MRDFILYFTKTKVWIINKGWMVCLAVVFSVVAIVGLFGNESIVGVAARKRELPIYCVQRDDKVASLSFDAAWGNI